MRNTETLQLKDYLSPARCFYKFNIWMVCENTAVDESVGDSVCALSDHELLGKTVFD